MLCCTAGAHTSSIDMKNHTHAARDVFEPANIECFAAAQKCTWIASGSTGCAPSHIYWLHYLDSKVGAKIYFPANRQPGEDAGALQERCNELVRDDKPEFLS